MLSALSYKIKVFVKIGIYILLNPRVLFFRSSYSNGKRQAGKIHIIYRHVHINHDGRSRDPKKFRPPWFTHEKCFRNLFNTIKKSPFKNMISLTIVYDGSVDEFNSDFIFNYYSVITEIPISVRIVEAGSNMKSWYEAIAAASSNEFNDSDLIYFMENDYQHSEGWIEKVAELCDSGIKFDYVSLYDHTDMYDFVDQSTLPVHGKLKSRIYVTKSHHWRVAPSTCGTFIVRKKVFFEDSELWRANLSDHYVFTFLSKIRKRVLLTPIPGLATHCMEGQLSPTIAWSDDEN